MFWREQGAGDESVVRFTGVLDATNALPEKVAMTPAVSPPT